MLRKIIICLMMLTSLTAFAQQRVIEPSEGEQWWGYYMGSEELKGLGYATRGHYDVCIFIPGDEGIGQNATISAVRFFITTVNNLSNVKAWASTTLPEEGKPETADIETVSVPKSSIIVRADGTNDVAFKPFKVPEGGVYVGYSFDIDDYGHTDTNYPVVVTRNTEDINNALYLYVSTNKSWVNCYDWGGNYGNLALKVLISGNLLENAVDAISAGEAVALVNNTAGLPVKIFNNGSKGVKSLGYTVTVDGIESDIITHTLDNPFTTFHSDTTLLLPVPTGADAVKKQYTLTLKQVNGVANEAEAAMQTTTGNVIAVKQNTPRRVVMEEFTGTWCGWCMRGIKGIELSSEIFGDQFIPIAVHGDDPMKIDEYLPLRQSVGGLPTCLLNRYFECDPYYGEPAVKANETSRYGVDRNIRELLGEIVEGGIEAHAWFDETDENCIRVSAATTFQYTDNNALYAIGLVLVGNDLEGAGSQWIQENYYPNYKDIPKYNDDDNLREYLDGETLIRDMQYKHVAIAGVGVENGGNGTLPKEISCGTEIVSDMQINIAGNELVQSRDKLEVVAMLFNTSTGRIVSAAKTAVFADKATQINDTETTITGKREIYDLQGRRHNSLQRGLNIITNEKGEKIKIVF